MKTRKTRKRKNTPTPAQLRARAKFVKMVRARAAAKRKANPGRRGLRGATAKQERQYELIKKSERKSGRSLKDSKRIAAATVRKRSNPPADHLLQQYQLDLAIAREELRDAKKTGNRRLIEGAERELKLTWDLLKKRREFVKANKFFQGRSKFPRLLNPRKRNKTVIKARKVKIMATNPRRKRNALTPRDREQLLGVNKLIRSLRSRIAKSKSASEKAFLRQQMIELRGSQFGLRSKKRNPTVTAKSRATKKLFTGTKSKKTLSLLAPKGAPKSMAILGKLVKVKTRSKTFTPPRKRGRNPEAEIYLAAGDSGQLFIVGDPLPVIPGPARDLGEIVEIDYTARKPHLGYPETTEFFHEMGEETGDRPHLVTDGEGHLKIVGGEYYIEKDGVHN